jgi:hypothetical protein
MANPTQPLYAIGSNARPSGQDKKCICCTEEVLRTGSPFCYDCREAADALKIPRENEFRNEKHIEIDFLLAPDLARIGRNLIDRYAEDFSCLVESEIDYFWKRAGGVSGGQSVLGKCVKVTGALKFYSDKDFLIWLAADNCAKFDYYKLTATVFHELKHAWFNSQASKAELIGHDFEGFAREIEIFGAWRNNAVMMQKAFESVKQPKLFE